LHTIHSPLSSIVGNKSQIASVRSIVRCHACTPTNQHSQ
jgi:hypothetical protein